MGTKASTLAAWVLLSVLATMGIRSASAQQSKPKPSPNPVPAQGATDSAAAQRAEILKSERWRRVMFQMNEWLSAQPFYDKKQVEQIKANQSAAVAKMSAGDLEFMLEDMEAKFRILQSKEAQDARAWMWQNLSVLTDKKREEVLKGMPNIATMTAPQLSQQIARIQQKRASLAREQATYHQLREEQVDATLSASSAAQQAYLRSRDQAPRPIIRLTSINRLRRRHSQMFAPDRTLDTRWALSADFGCITIRANSEPGPSRQIEFRLGSDDIRLVAANRSQTDERPLLDMSSQLTSILA